MEGLTHKAQLKEVELERTTKQLKEAIAVAGEETAKCKAAKEVIKSLTAQVRRILLTVHFMNGELWVYLHIFSGNKFFTCVSEIFINNGSRMHTLPPIACQTCSSQADFFLQLII